MLLGKPNKGSDDRYSSEINYYTSISQDKMRNILAVKCALMNCGSVIEDVSVWNIDSSAN